MPLSGPLVMPSINQHWTTCDPLTTDGRGAIRARISNVTGCRVHDDDERPRPFPQVTLSPGGGEEEEDASRPVPRSGCARTSHLPNRQARVVGPRRSARLMLDGHQHHQAQGGGGFGYRQIDRDDRCTASRYRTMGVAAVLLTGLAVWAIGVASGVDRNGRYAGRPIPDGPNGRVLVFSDEFDALDTYKWQHEVTLGGGGK